jgi:hypothetical protein
MNAYPPLQLSKPRSPLALIRRRIASAAQTTARFIAKQSRRLVRPLWELWDWIWMWIWFLAFLAAECFFLYGVVQLLRVM